MNIIRNLFVSVTLLLLMSAGSYSQYDNDNDGNKNMKTEKHFVGKEKSSFADELKLTDQQKNDIKKIRLNARKTILPLRNLLMEKRAHLKSLSVADKVNMAEINKTIDDITGLMAQIMKQREAEKQEVRKILTDEQRMIFDTRPNPHQKMRREIIKEYKEEE